ncbi:hypothetical protein WICPIJ_006321 [Wickerhamomyces pijperi]|uniref:Uncharacterized protein n=1 Tax=Wickerhamomyces pijperi TaxID=599730 RepID=A0A9P8TL49_WICPI|nr:hypothetical protein WICPIJ_006321 [Wickerhamomyces pijperi]
MSQFLHSHNVPLATASFFVFFVNYQSAIGPNTSDSSRDTTPANRINRTLMSGGQRALFDPNVFLICIIDTFPNFDGMIITATDNSQSFFAFFETNTPHSTLMAFQFSKTPPIFIIVFFSP